MCVCVCVCVCFAELITPVRTVRPLVQQVVRGAYVHVISALPTV